METPSDAASLLGFADLSGRTKLRFTGADRVRFVNGQISNDARRAATDQSIYACVMTIKGKMCADVFVHAEPESLVIDAEAELRETLAARLERYIIADDVQLEDVTEELALLHILPLTGEDVAAPPPLASLDDQAKAQMVRSYRYGRTGWDLFFPAASRENVRARLAQDYPEIVPARLEALRIVAGTPRWGAELDENTMPAEANLEERAVDYAKGCYIGQEVVSRIKSIGHVNRSLCVLRSVDPAANLRAGMLLYPANAPQPQTKNVGRVTSVSPSAGGDDPRPTALGYVRRGWEDAGSELDAVDPSGEEGHPSIIPCRVKVCSLPSSKK